MTDDPEFEEWHLYALEEPYQGGDERKFENYWMARAFIAGKSAGRKAAIEECAKVAEAWSDFTDAHAPGDQAKREIAVAIRSIITESQK